MKRLMIIALVAASLSFALQVMAQSQSRPRQSVQTPTLGTFGAEVRYVLHPGDVLDIQYRYTPEFNQTVTVEPDGFISLEIGGDVKVGGRNLEQVRNLILTKAQTR